MKVTKKLLSVLLAVIMIMTSMSVCFGTIASAADDAAAVENFINAMKVDAMKNFSTTGGTASTTGSGNAQVTTRTYTYQAATYADYLEVKEVVRRLNLAIKGLDEYKNTHHHKQFEMCAEGDTQCGDLGTVRKALENAIGSTELSTLKNTYKLDSLLNTVLNMESVTYRNKDSVYGVSTNTTTRDSNLSKYYHNTLIVKNVSVKQYLSEQTDISSVADTIDTEYKYTLSMGRANWTTGWLIKTNHYHAALSTTEAGAECNAPAVSGENATNKSVLSDMEGVLKANKDYLDKSTIAGIHSVSSDPATLNAVANDLEAKYSAVKTAYGDTDAKTIFNHFFGTSIQYDSVANLVSLLRTSAVIAGYSSVSETIDEDYEIYANETYKTYTSTEVNALYNELKTAYEGFKAADDALEASIALYYGIDDIIDEIPDVLDALNSYYYEIFLGSIKERAFGEGDEFGYVNEYQNWTVEDIDNDVITSADILTALNEVTLDIDTLTKDASDADVQDFFGMSKAELIEMLTTVKSHLENPLGYYAGLNDRLYAQYYTFTNNIANVINADSANLYRVLSGYEGWYKNLETFFTTWEAEVGEYRELLEDGLKEEMNAYMAEAYVALQARVEGQIDYAYDLYEVYYDLYENNVTMASLTYFNTLKKSIEAIEVDAYNWMKDSSEYGEITDEAIRQYNALQVIYGAYGTFVANRGFDTYTQTVVDSVREDSVKEIFRENGDIDDDGIGEYEVADEDIEAIIDLLEAALRDETVKKLLGDLINKNKETGEPTGEPFDIAALLNGLIEGIYSDSLVNTIVQFLYPVVAKAFLDVWEGINPVVDTKAAVDGIGELDVHAILELYNVDDAIENAGMAIAPANLAHVISKDATNKTKYADAIKVLESVTVHTAYDDEGNYIDPWQDDKLFEQAVNEDGTLAENEDGTPKMVYKLDWGIDEAENKRAAFIDAACAALSGLEPLLKALILNQKFVSPNIQDSSGGVRGGKIGVSGAGTTASLGSIELTLTLDPITLMLDVSANDGWDNVLAPIFEALGLTNIPHSEDMLSIRDFLEDGLFVMIDQLLAKVAANPIKTILDIIPNLVYALEADLVAPLLDLLAIEIYYEADTHYSALKIPLLLPNGINGNLQAVMKAEKNEYINVGQMLDLESMGVNLSGGLAGILEMIGINIPMPDVSVLATAGTLEWKDTNRSKWTYSYQPAGVSGKAAHINANRADVLEYLVKYAFGNLNGLLVAFNVDTSAMDELVTGLLDNVAKNPDGAVAAIVELLNQKAYPAKNYEWFDGDVNGETVVGNSAYEIYMNPGNDWTKEKAEYLYNNLDSILTAALSLAGAEFDLGATIDGAVDGLLTDKTLTALAALLAKLDLNALLNKDKTEEEIANALDVNALITQFLGLDLAAVAAQYADIAAAVGADPEYVASFGVDAGEKTFAAALSEMLAPLSVVLDYLLAGGNLEITLGEEKVTLIGTEGYKNAIIPLLEALGCEVEADPANALEATINALTARIGALTEGDVIKNIIDILPGVFYFISSGALSTTVLNLLQPILVIVDTIRPVIDVMPLIEEIKIGDKTLAEFLGGELDLEKLNLEFVFNLLPSFIDLDLSGLKAVIYDICNEVGTEYTSASAVANTLNGKAMKGAYTENFDQADLLTVVLSFVLEWATVEENGKKLDEMLGTEDLIANIGKVFEDVEIAYGTPNWMYWFATEEEFNSYVEGNTELPNTLLSLTYPNDWSEEAAAYIADNLASLVDMVISLIEIDGTKYASVAELIDAKLDVFNAETINSIIGLIADLLKDVDDNLLSVGYLLDVDVVGLKNYTCTAEVNDVKSFAAELANVLTTYAGGLVNWLFFGDDFRFAKKSDKTDTIVINGGEGYEKGLALVLEALGCDLPEKATTETVLLALAARVEEILASPVNEVIDLLPNLVYFLNADGASVAVNNLLAPVYALLDKLAVLGVELDLAGLLGFDLKYLSLADILALVKDKTGLDLSAAEEILVNLCFGKIEQAEYTYKMVAERKDVVTVVLTTALLLVKDEDFAAKLEEMMGTELISAIAEVFESAPVTYKTPDWYALDESDIDYDNETVGVIKYAITYPNNWTEESAKYLADNLVSVGDMVAGIIDSNYDSLGALLADKVNIYTADTLKAIQNLLADLIGGLDENLKELVNVGLGAADALLGADVQGLLDYDVSSVNDKASFIAALTGMLMEVEGLVDWLLLGQSYELFVDDVNANGVYDEGEAIITLNGGHGYAEGLALVLEALGVENLPDVYAMEEIDTEAVVGDVLNAVFDRVDAIFNNPVEEVFEILPNVLYFINANGLTVAIENLLGAVNALLIKLEGLGIELDIASLVNFSEILGVETELALDNITMKAVIDLVAELTGLNLDAVADVLVGFALGRVAAYDSVSSADITAKMYYHDDFAKYDMITVLATVAIIILTDEANAEKVKDMLGEDIYQVVLNLVNMGEVEIQEFNWMFTSEETGGNRVGETFSALESSEAFAGHSYGPTFTEEMAQYIADNFGKFVDNVIYLLGIDINSDGKAETNLTETINSLLNGSLYNSENVIAVRDALAGVLANLTELQVNGKVVGGLIADVLKTTGIADIAAVAEVEIPEFKEDRAQFVASLCDVLEPLYGILRYVLADEDFTFFVNAEKSDAITLKGAEGYAYGILPLLETLECEGILAPADYYAAVEADGDVLLTSILNPLLDRVDVILEAPADEILAMLPNLIYFINSNGVDTVVKNTLNAVYALLAAIEPIAKIDLYELIGVDLAVIDFEWLLDKLLEVIKDATGYEFTVEDIDYILELTVGKLEAYDSLNGKTAYKMVYSEGEIGDSKELVVVVLRLIVTFIANENNAELLVGLLRDNLGMSAEVEEFVRGLLTVLVECVSGTKLGVDVALSTLYYVFFGIDKGVGEAVGGSKTLDQLWRDALSDLRRENEGVADMIEDILGWDIFEDVISPDGIAPNGLIAFFQKIISWFQSIVAWFKSFFKIA